MGSVGVIREKNLLLFKRQGWHKNSEINAICSKIIILSEVSQKKKNTI